MSTDLAALLESALAEHRAGDLEAAGRGYRRILEAHPDHPDALNLLAIVAMEAGDYESAVAHLRRAIAVAGAVAQFHCHLGNALQGAGDLDAAAGAYRQAVALEPGHLEALSNLGFVLIRQGRPADAIAPLEQALAIDPRYFYALNNLGDAASSSGDLARAAHAYRRAIAVQPAVGELHRKLAVVLREQGRLAEAAEEMWRALEAGSDDTATWRSLGVLLRRTSPSAYDAALEQRLLGFFDAAGVDHADAAEFAAALIVLKYAGEPRFGDPRDHRFVLETLLRDPLARRLLTQTVNGDDTLETLLTGARRALLLGEAELAESVLPALSVLAQQCCINEHVLAVTDEERSRLDALRAGIEEDSGWAGAPATRAQLSLLLYAAYAPLDALANASRLAAIPLGSFHESLRPLVERGLLEPAEELALEDEIPSIGDVRDPVSAAVRAQYEANPYPRWLTPAYRPPGNLHGILQGMFPHFEPPARLRGPIRVLVVGCGTGRHPISIALRYANAEVLATDISRRSLAYGLRMARRLGVDNVTFVQNDLLELSELDDEFEVIECVGVLHHTASIEASLGRLLEKLHPDGVLKLGLYSSRAREPVAYARRRIAELGLQPTADDIRRFRAMVLAAPADDQLRRILDLGDFYTLSNCRDLLFHVHETQVTLAEVDALLAATGLRLIGFENADPAPAEAYRRRYPDDTSMTNLARWAMVEEENPGTIPDTYQFWCARSAGAQSTM
ncbi:MAG: tetratricopeptide repeat protein [Gammaproteobacteria bacterium]|nr:tetratricopeptide repeat protein [Gammaproteobacteria bacterium]